jgi:hypothetical protein
MGRIQTFIYRYLASVLELWPSWGGISEVAVCLVRRYNSNYLGALAREPKDKR